ncbi:MAG: PadR family transcriptional regulator [bacterium]|nr:PadR family transcriptional regulator [bacterium]
MKDLSRQEEFVLLSIWRLKDNAYGVTIRRYLTKITGKEWTLGAIYVPMYRLSDKGYVRSYLSDPTEERGGRSKRMYTTTPQGMDALNQTKKMHDRIWETVPDTIAGS